MDWQSIQTAPKDGQEIIGWVRAIRYGHDGGDDAYSMDTSQADLVWWNRFESFWEKSKGQVGDSEEVTHWIPLPNDPPRGI